MEKNGFVDLGVLSPELDILTVANQLGTIDEIQGLSDVQRLSPRTKEEFPKNTYSGNYGMDEFPLHTDLAHWHHPPRYFLLRCVVPDSEVCTSILHFKKALKGLSQITKARAVFRPRRKLENKMFFLRLIQDEIHRWDQLYLTPENREAEDVSAYLRALGEAKCDKIFLTKPAQSLLVDNWKVLHGRSTIETPTRSRLIERVYLSGLHL